MKTVKGFKLKVPCCDVFWHRGQTIWTVSGLYAVVFRESILSLMDQEVMTFTS